METGKFLNTGEKRAKKRVFHSKIWGNKFVKKVPKKQKSSKPCINPYGEIF